MEEGSEHYLFYVMEKKYQHSFIHGHIIGLGMYIMSRLQQNKWEEITKFMDEVGLHYHPEHMGLTREGVREVLLNPKTFVTSRNELWFTNEEIVETITKSIYNVGYYEWTVSIQPTLLIFNSMMFMYSQFCAFV